MRFGLIFSILLHAIVLGLFIITIKRMPLLNETPDIPVEVTTVAELANVKAASKLQEPKEAPAPAPTPAPPPQQAAPPEEAPPAPAPPLPSETKPKQAPKEQPKPEAEPKARPAPPTAEKQKDQKFDLDAIAVLINKEQKTQEKQVKSAQAKPGDTAEKPREQVGAGTDMTITLTQLMKREVEACWSFPAGAVQPESLDVYIIVYLRADGTLAQPPQIENESRMSEPYFRAAAESAIRAINQCQPYQLPQDQYDVWKQGFRLNFDPSKMIGISSTTSG